MNFRRSILNLKQVVGTIYKIWRMFTF